MAQQTFGQTPQYRQALAALSALKERYGLLPELKDIAAGLIAGNQALMPERRFPYVGDPADPRDRAVVEAHETAWKDFLIGDDDDGYPE